MRKKSSNVLKQSGPAFSNNTVQTIAINYKFEALGGQNFRAAQIRLNITYLNLALLCLSPVYGYFGDVDSGDLKPLTGEQAAEVALTTPKLQCSASARGVAALHDST
ncbi:hypothetical protein A9Q02_22700 [Candidatus Chloroploca asiatica]|uniref:Uncharacterized protein n=1 Tax=Candidatus Chloroploca asiatica TaxID=1506545 RepID=A0A2H3L2Q3_9CHLR|nr:hypothetical protein A9Q02_22700 [Candidatus Chloroploca asiatica]